MQEGKPALVRADAVSMPNNAYAPNIGWWAMLPIVVYGYDDKTAWIAVRSTKPLQVSAEEEEFPWDAYENAKRPAIE